MKMFTMRQLLRETALGYLFWTLFQALAPMIWFYPLNELEITGYEAFAVVLFSPILLGVPKFGDLLRSHHCISFLRLLAVASLGSFQASTTLSRLVILSGGLFCILIVLSASISHYSSRQRCQTIHGLVLGLFAFISSRVWFTTFVPAWWDNTSNSVVISVVTVAAIDKFLAGDEEEESKKTQSTILPPTRGSWFTTSLGFGSLVYITQAVFGDTSLISRWVVRGYPDPGPSPYPWGALVLIALWFGALLSRRTLLVTSLVWWLTGAASFVALYLLPTWLGFAGGLLLAVYIASVWPVLADQVSMCPPGRTMFVVGVVWLIELLFSVWTVAYNFVPGGEYTRERTILLVVASILCIGLALFTGKRTVGVNRGSFSAFPVQDVKTGVRRMPDSNTLILLTLLVAGGLGGFAYRLPRQQFTHTDKPEITVAIWTYHFGYDNVGWPSLERSATLLRDTGADVITLLESDASKPYLGNNDLGMWLGERLGMYVDFGPSTRDHTWGNLILSKYPIVKSTHHLLPSPHGELAPAISATVNTSRGLVDFVVTHMGNDKDVLDRELQAAFLAKELKSAVNPVVFLGYVTSKPHSRDYVQLTQKGQVKDIDSTDKDRWCEYIMYRGLVRLGYARISHGGLSDTEIQSARFLIPKLSPGEQYVDNERMVTEPGLVDPSIHFNSRFGEFRDGHNWIQDHLFHMSTPKYFLPKK